MPSEIIFEDPKAVQKSDEVGDGIVFPPELQRLFQGDPYRSTRTVTIAMPQHPSSPGADPITIRITQTNEGQDGRMEVNVTGVPSSADEYDAIITLLSKTF